MKEEEILNLLIDANKWYKLAYDERDKKRKQIYISIADNLIDIYRSKVILI